MNTSMRCIATFLVFVFLLPLFSCGKSEEAQPIKSKRRGRRRAKQAATPKTIPYKDIIENAGFVTTSLQEISFSDAREGGLVIVYKSVGEEPSGGIIYFRRIGVNTAPSWHWYFEDAAPDSADFIELNEDGLWDIRVMMKDGSVRDFFQDETFTLFAGIRNDLIAMNGTSSPPTDAGHGMWKCFDGDSRTTWRSSLENRSEVFLEFFAPFGIQHGNLMIQTLDEDCPKECWLYAEGELVKRFELEKGAGQQMIHVGETIQNAKKIRLVVRSTYGSGDQVSIAELNCE